MILNISPQKPPPDPRIILHRNVASSFPTFLVRFNHITGSCKNSCKKSMVKIFFIIIIADRLAKQLRHLQRHFFFIPTPHSGKQSPSVLLPRTFLKPFLDRTIKYLFYLCIGDTKRHTPWRQLFFTLIRFCLGQIPSKVEHTP